MNSIIKYFKLLGLLVYLTNFQIGFSQNSDSEISINDSIRICSQFGENAKIKKNRVVSHEDMIRMEYEILNCVINSPQFTLINKLNNNDTCFFYRMDDDIPKAFLLLQKNNPSFNIISNIDFKCGTWFVGDIYLFPFIENQTKIGLILYYYYDIKEKKEIDIEVTVEKNENTKWEMICFNIYSWK